MRLCTDAHRKIYDSRMSYTIILLFFCRYQQRLLSRCEWRLEQTFSEHSDCCETAERCSTELERLRRERETLVQRLHEIDSDIERVIIAIW